MKLLAFAVIVTWNILQVVPSGNKNDNIYKHYFQEITDFFLDGTRASRCGSSLKLIDCDINDPAIFSRKYLNKIRAIYIEGTNCKLRDMYFHWDIIVANSTVLGYDHYKNRETFYLKPYMVGGGTHHFMVYCIEVYQDNTIGSISDACTFIITPEYPLAVIKGGSEITVESHKPIILDASESIDMEVPPNTKGNLRYIWSCSVSDESLSNYCKNKLPSGAILTVPAKYAINGLTYTFGLNVTSKELKWSEIKQIINVKTKASVIKIRCIKNCSPLVQVTNVKEAVILQAICVRNCEFVDEQAYYWSINLDTFDYENYTEFGRNYDTFYMYKNILEMNKTYEVTLKLLDNLVGSASIEIITHTPPHLDSCFMIPEKGEALKTHFSVSCKYQKGQYMFEIYSIVGNDETLLERSARLQDIIFSLGANSKVKIKIIDQYEYSDFQIITPHLEDTFNPSSNEELIEYAKLTYFDKKSDWYLEELIKTKKYEKVIQALNAFVVNLGSVSNNKDFEKSVIDYKLKILDTLEEIPLDSRDRIKQVASIAKIVAEQNMLKQIPDIAQKATTVCKNASKKQLGLLSSERFKESFTNEMTEDIRLFSLCSQVGIIPNWELLEYPEVPFIPTTPYPLLEFPVITEDYPDYLDDENVSKVISKFDSSSKNLVKICLFNTKVLAETISSYEPTKFLESSIFNATATRRFGKDIPNIKISSQHVTVSPSPDFLKTGNSNIDILLCTSSMNPYWYINSAIINTTVAILQFQIKNQIVNKFTKPFLITFDHNITESDIITHNGTTPRIPNQSLSEEERLFERMTMYRITVYQRQGYFVEFLEMEEMELKVYLTKQYKPRFEEFNNNYWVINGSYNKFFITNEKNYNLYHYLMILPPNGTNDTKYFKYKIYTLSCYSWESNKRSWEISCGGTSNSVIKTIECACYKSSVLAGWLINNAVKEEYTVFKHLNLKVEAHYIIFFTLLLIWILYCIFLTYFSITPSKDRKKEIYFLSDTPSFYRYAYIIIIKTGNKRRSGTTSNIIIKLYGTSSESKEHILNYPDPEKRILQKNQEDWFLLATEYYLGDIENIKLWFDSIGYKPEWYCAEIEVIDLQKEKYWLFLINFRFNLAHSSNTVYTAKPIHDDKIKKKITRKQLPSAFHGSHLWNIRQKDPYFTQIERITIMLSTCLITFTIILFMYGCPRMEITDSIEPYKYYGFNQRIIWSSLGAAILTFCIHYPIIHLFRKTCTEKTKSKWLKIRWFMLILLIMLSMSILLIFGFWVPQITGLLWLTSSVLSLIIYVAVFENLMSCINTVTINRKSRIEEIFAKGRSLLELIEYQRDIFYEQFGKFNLRPYFLKDLYKPMELQKIKERKRMAMMKARLLVILEDIIMIMIYAILLYIIILEDRDPMTIYSNSEIKDLIKGIHSRSISGDLQYRQEIDNYLNYTFIQSTQSSQWYGKYISNDPGMTIDSSNKYIGIARLRQHRSHNKSCVVPMSMAFVQTSCITEYSDAPEYKNFSERWDSDEKSDPFARMNTVWKYKESNETGTLVYIGKFTTYPGGGYVATFGRTLMNSYLNLQYLFRNNWIDKHTRSIFIEFLAYSSNTNIFNAITILFEISTTGYIKTTYNVHTSRLLFPNDNSITMWMVFYGFIGVVTILTIKLICKILERNRINYKDIWQIIDIMIISLSLVCIYFYVKRSHLVGAFLDKIEKAKHNEFVNYFHLFYAEVFLTSMAAVLVFLATFRIWKLLRFLIIIKVVEKTLILSAMSLLCLFMCHVHLIMVFSITGFLLFGDESADFKNISESFMSLVLASLGFFSFNFSIFESSIHYLFFITYMLVNMLIVTLYVAVISIYYSAAQNFYSNFDEYNVINYLKENFDYYKELFKVRCIRNRMKGGEDPNSEIKNPVFPKSDEHRYAKCLTTEKNKIAAMKQIALSTIRNLKPKDDVINENDVILIKDTVKALFETQNDEDKELFFLVQLQGYKTSLIHDQNFIKIENILNMLYGSHEEHKSEDIYQMAMDNQNKQLDRILNSLSIVKIGLNSVLVEK